MVVSNKDEDIDAPPELERHIKKEEKRKGKDPEPRTEDSETAAPPKKEKKGKRNDNELNGEAESNEENTTIIGNVEMAEPVKREKRRKEKGVNGTNDSIEGQVEMATGVDTKRKEKRRREKDADVAKTDLDRVLDAQLANRKKKRKLQEDEFKDRKKKRTKAVEDS